MGRTDCQSADDLREAMQNAGVVDKPDIYFLDSPAKITRYKKRRGSGTSLMLANTGVESHEYKTGAGRGRKRFLNKRSASIASVRSIIGRACG
jgi:hypothetical protein